MTGILKSAPGSSRAMAVLGLAILSAIPFWSGASAAPSDGWWTEDVWTAPDRPFLYYGREAEKAREEAKRKAPEKDSAEVPKKLMPEVEKDPDDFSRFSTMEEVRKEYSLRLDRAVMTPTAENVAALQAISVYIFGKSQTFAEAFERSRLSNPRYDWTASHPSANFAVVELAASEDRRMEAFMNELALESGLIFVGGPNAEANALALGPAAAFAHSHGFEVLAVSTSAPIPERDGIVVRPDNGIARQIGDGSPGPFIALLPKPGSRSPLLEGSVPSGKPLLFSSGIASVTELRRRLLIMLAPPPSAETDARSLLRRAEGARRQEP
ncbi:conjugal transfer protein TraF [uncultured Sutterella sp.]|uniref:conjugal transfer protein TraF n=1 Tax=uncultured Sutterella sp. TaxID=286133 RepID=UPI002632D40C|nr:conjugal transfer protein TraF [uncultured Sutterella sp.]